MKTTIDIADPILRAAKKVAERDGTTLRALVEQGLRRVVTERKKQTGFKLRDASFKGGTGLTPEMQGADWDKFLEVIYEGRGG
jgi:hypothetical protein